MSDTKPTPTPQSNPNPAQAAWQTSAEPWTKMVNEQLGRMNQMVDEAAKVERQGTEQFMHAIDEMARVQKETFGYMLRLNAEWRRTAVDAMKQGATFVNQKGV